MCFCGNILLSNSCAINALCCRCFSGPAPCTVKSVHRLLSLYCSKMQCKETIISLAYAIRPGQVLFYKILRGNFRQQSILPGLRGFRVSYRNKKRGNANGEEMKRSLIQLANRFTKYMGWHIRRKTAQRLLPASGQAPPETNQSIPWLGYTDSRQKAVR